MLRPALRGVHLRALCPPRPSTTTPCALRQLSSSPSSRTAQEPTHPPTIEPSPAAPSQPSSPAHTNPVTHTIPLPPSPPRPARSSSSSSPNEAYTITRTPSNSLPVYQFHKAGGNLQLTRVRRISGDVQALRGQLETALRPVPQYVRVNGTTGHVIVRGWYKKQIEEFLTERGF